MADAKNDMTLLVNDQTEFRAQATFLRTVVTRNTPFDRFLAGDNGALDGPPTARRQAVLHSRGKWAGGAGCFTCHSGPMLNKQPDDPDVAGIGQFVEENFFNVGIGDHPVQALNALARGHLDPTRLGKDGFPYHAEDTGRKEITHNPDDVFKFRILTLRQLKDARTFFHNGSFTKFGMWWSTSTPAVPQDPTAGAALTLSARFTHPRGPVPSWSRLERRQVDDLTDFLENALYDPAFVNMIRTRPPNLQLNERDLTYSKYRPDLAALGAKDGFMLSGLAIDNNDPLSRRDQGLEFLDVTPQTTIERLGSSSQGGRQTDQYKITNKSQSVVDTHLLIVVRGLLTESSWKMPVGPRTAAIRISGSSYPMVYYNPARTSSRRYLQTSRAGTITGSVTLSISCRDKATRSSSQCLAHSSGTRCIASNRARVHPLDPYASEARRRCRP